MTRSAVLFLVFNRPALTRRTFAAIRAARPPRLLVHADGPRLGRNENALCEQTRQVTEAVDWPCEVRRIYRNENLGCGRAVSDAISRFFEWVGEGIVVEDDCTPSPLFFDFCDLMLDRFRADERVMHVSGMGVEFPPASRQAEPGPAVSLAPFPFVWGWASWRRAWQAYAFSLPDAAAREAVIARYNHASPERAYWREKLAATHDGAIDTWDYQWVFALWRCHGLAVTPGFSLVENHGAGEHATHAAAVTAGFAPPLVSVSLPALPEISAVDGQAAMSVINSRCLGLDRSYLGRWMQRMFHDHPRLSWWFLGIRRRIRTVFALR